MRSKCEPYFHGINIRYAYRQSIFSARCNTILDESKTLVKVGYCQRGWAVHVHHGLEIDTGRGRHAAWWPWRHVLESSASLITWRKRGVLLQGSHLPGKVFSKIRAETVTNDVPVLCGNANEHYLLFFLFTVTPRCKEELTASGWHETRLKRHGKWVSGGQDGLM